MKTKIQKSLEQLIPDFFSEEKISEIYSDYELLNLFTKYIIKLFNQNDIEKVKEYFKIINIIYHNGNLHDRNAIENEILTVFANEESPGSLRSHMEIMPKELRPVYLKAILEN
jgi:hypothetical protein